MHSPHTDVRSLLTLAGVPEAVVLALASEDLGRCAGGVLDGGGRRGSWGACRAMYCTELFPSCLRSLRAAEWVR